VVTRWLKHLKVAVDTARGSTHIVRKSYFGAVVASKRRVLGASYNLRVQHPSLVRRYPSHCCVHAEAGAMLNAIKEAGDIAGCDLFVTRIFRPGEIAPDSKPCDHCIALMKHLGIRRCFYVYRGDITIMSISRDRDDIKLGPMDAIENRSKKE
jgi:tRNA(Arg) A34 adenosine deaminase TadA